MSNASTVPDISGKITVSVPVEQAFQVFTSSFGTWWPREYHIGQAEMAEAILEPGEGGRWYERGTDGSECDWGRVLVWDPPGRLVLAWEISPDWKHDDSVDTEVEVRFVSLGPALTRIELEHRRLDRYGTAAEQMRGIFDSENGWNAILSALALRVRDSAKA